MKTTVNILSIMAMVLTLFQGLIPAMPISDTTVTSAVVMFLVSGTTIWKQALSNEIDTNAIWPTIILAIIATFGGVNDLVKVFHFSDVTGQWIRFAITFITGALNILSKVLWPTPQTSSKI